MPKPALKIRNRDARRLWLDAQGLSRTPTGNIDVRSIVRRLGLLQLDTIRVVARAHHHILWSRNQNYREPMLGQAMAERRELFEHFTHDACVLTMEMYPMWRRQFRRLEEKVRGWEWHRGMLDTTGRNAIKERIRKEGPLSTRAFRTEVANKGMWKRPPHKLALDYMWYAGELSTSHRKNFTKYYDLTERIVPEPLRTQTRSDEEQIEWLCHEALTRLRFATHGDIQRFWEAMSNQEAKDWTEAQAELVPVDIECADKAWHRALAPPDIEVQLAELPVPTSRLRILNPFDPVIRDRKRLKRLFGFDYTIEIFVPAAKRKWGYYVYPLLEGDRMVGRIEVVGDRKDGLLTVKNVWPEPGVNWTDAREAKLESELLRMARFIGADEVIWT
ncbi:MAG: winged helix DNA-binding domain-containing protein [Gammaproteobacteria bacterium]|nr:winged helix DNA-binding domain-containing protein [Gammaproteobacteria bacterium]NNF61728.1 winged helix-turn-helix domain-containing protein [Gammaproteobacteria bacterium]NNM19705.1 winged helix-turn-helix domain-containing protein [Gammaproteobacteria bacterium]